MRTCLMFKAGLYLFCSLQVREPIFIEGAPNDNGFSKADIENEDSQAISRVNNGCE